MKCIKTPLQPFGLLLEFSEVKVSRLNRVELLKLVEEHKLILIRGLPTLSREELLNLAAQNQEQDLIHWNFGPVMEMKADPQTKNYLFSREAVPFHWDGAFHEEPRVLLFQCLEAPNPEMGGATTFSNTENIWSEAPAALRDEWMRISLTYETAREAHYGGRFTTPMVSAHPSTRNTVLRFAEPVDSALNPVSLKIQGLQEDRSAFLNKVRELLYAERYCFQHVWQDNDILLADNHSLLHGRQAFSNASPRHLRRVQLR